jgi:hypothetical protein
MLLAREREEEFKLVDHGGPAATAAILSKGVISRRMQALCRPFERHGAISTRHRCIRSPKPVG